ncbi:hypothetical protein ACTJI2_15405 [Pseudoxanthomonas sp. 22568]|uniref:hypothetical protein n=1 Tax=Pseudoxanthomonas sp. 22568 TaxID=3453945 RepID=UPI003F85094A
MNHPSNRNRFLPRPHIWLWMLVFVTYAAAAATVVINAMDAPYRDLQRTPAGVRASQEDRAIGAAQMVALYRARSGAPFSALPAGTTLEVTWPDGSSETLRIVDPLSPTGVVPVKGTQKQLH